MDLTTNETLKMISTLVKVSDGIMAGMRELADGGVPETNGRTPKRYKLKDAADLLGKSVDAIRRAEQAGDLPRPVMRESGQRAGYDLADINRMRDFYRKNPWRGGNDSPVIMAVQNFKGGVGKSTISVHVAQHFAELGYRTLLVDCDSQASSTTLFGLNPDRDVAVEETLLPYLIEDRADSLKYCIRPTHWDRLDLIPANLSLYNAEYIISQNIRGNVTALSRLKAGLHHAAENYDILVIDPPPALGMISLSVLQAANALLIPTPPSSIDFASTATYLAMLEEVVEVLVEKAELPIDFKFISILATKVVETKGAHDAMRQIMGQSFSGNILPTALLDSAEFDTAAVEMRSVYELAGTPTKTHKRCINNLTQVMGDLEKLIRKTWPSHARRLREEGIA